MHDATRAYIAGFLDGDGIVCWSAVKRVLEIVEPYVVFKREQVTRALALLARLEGALKPQEFLEVAELVDAFATLNYSKHKHLDAHCVQEVLESKGLLVPVTTEASFQSRDRQRLPLRMQR